MVMQHFSFIILRAGRKEQSCAFIFPMVLNFICAHFSLYLTIAYRENMAVLSFRFDPAHTMPRISY